MSGWTIHDGTVVALPRANVDTDQIIPARFMSASRSEGYGGFLFADLRDGDPDFPLDRHPKATVLVAGENFGCGSSREAAVYALVDAGIRVVVAPSFADIFAGNAVNNGLLPAAIRDADRLIDALGEATATATVDLKAGTIEIDGTPYDFDIPAVWRAKLVNGWDDIDLTRAHEDAISEFRRARAATTPWAWPAAPG